MDFGLSGKGAWVLASGGGLGQATAQSLAREGANVALTDRDGGALHIATTAITRNGGRATGFVADLADLSSVTEMVHQARASLGSIDILVNITGARRRWSHKQHLIGWEHDEWRS